MITHIPYLLVRVVLICSIIFASTDLSAHFKSVAYSEFSKTNVSEGLFLNSAVLAEYGFHKNSIQIGSQFYFSGLNEHKGFDLLSNYSRELKVRNIPVKITAFFLYNNFSRFLYESNWGLYLETIHRQISYKLGTGFKTYGLTKKAVDQFEIENSQKLRENFNLIYSLSLYLKPLDFKWNACASVRNTDFFLLNQPTNPMFSLELKYQPSGSLFLFIESIYKSAGAFNLSVNPFGYSIRAGLIWYIID